MAFVPALRSPRQRRVGRFKVTRLQKPHNALHFSATLDPNILNLLNEPFLKERLGSNGSRFNNNYGDGDAVGGGGDDDDDDDDN